MCVGIISHWFGRHGNNLIQLLNACHYCFFLKKCRFIRALNHPLFELKNKKNSNPNPCECPKLIHNTFYYNKKLGFELSPVEMKKLFDQFVRYKPGISSDQPLNEIAIHIRSGSIFSGRGHPLYIQPPLIFYQKLIESNPNKTIVCVYEDEQNPVIGHLKKQYYHLVKFQSSSVGNDIATLANSKHLIFSFGTFPIIPYLISETIEKVTIPAYLTRSWFEGEWLTEVEKVEFPNYIKPGTWSNSPAQRKLLLSYQLLD